MSSASPPPPKSIPDTFAGVDVFITGGSGFMGKVLIEKLLRSCPEIGQVFILLRAKKGKSAQERVNQLVQVPLFDKLRETNPESIQKIVPIAGDCAELKMGVDEASFKRMENVQFVFHVAASVRFDDPLDKAILLNTRGTREVLLWAKTLRQLRTVLYVSTTYSNPEIFEIEERIYPAKMDWKKAIEMAEKVDAELLEVLTPKITGFAPNTYTYTKGLAERICYDYRHELPLVIFRPSIVTNSEVEPIPGWIDNFNGPAGLLAGMGTGVVRTGYTNPEYRMNIIPVDVSIKAILIAAWKRASGPQGELPIYNSASELEKTVSYGFIAKEGEKIAENIPLSNMLWAPGGHRAWGVYMYYVLFFLYQLVPSFFVDLLLRLSGRKPMLMKVQRSIFYAQDALKYFTDNEWVFQTNNFRKLCEDLSEEDKKNFKIEYINNGLYEYFSTAILGGRRYLFKDPDETIPQAKKKLKRFQLINKIAKSIFTAVILYLVYRTVYPNLASLK